MKYDSAGRVIYGFPIDDDLTISGSWTFTEAPIFEANPIISTTGTIAQLTFIDGDADADEQSYFIRNSNGTLSITAALDASPTSSVGGTNLVTVQRTGVTIDSMSVLVPLYLSGVDTNGYALKLSGVGPAIAFRETDAAADEGGWDIVAASTGGDGTIRFRSNSDAEVDTNWMVATKAGTTVTNIAFTATDYNFSGTVYCNRASGANTPALRLESTVPVLQWNDTDAAADGKLWRMYASGTGFHASARSDADNSGTEWLSVTRSGTSITDITLNATQVSITGEFACNGQTPIARPDYTVTNPSTDRALNVTADTTAQVAAVLGTLIADLIAIGLLQ